MSRFRKRATSGRSTPGVGPEGGPEFDEAGVNSPDLTPSPYWDQLRHQDRRPFLLARNRIKRTLRDWFERQGFMEVETSCLQVSPGNETHLHAFTTELVAPDGTASPLYLHTSPEFACKKLLAAGEPKIFTFAPVFRNRERGPLHHPEFTMLEWYRAGVSYTELMDDCTQLLRLAATAAGSDVLQFRGAEADVHAPPQRIRVAAAFADHAGIDLFASITEQDTDRDALAAAATDANIRVADDDSWSDIFSRILVEKVEPKLGLGRPTLLYDYPICEAALARASRDDPRVAERFELYACGVELTNGFGELTDANVQRQRFEADMQEKQRIYGISYPIDEDFLAALRVMPEASGCALGFDRLVMLASGAPNIEAVMWTPLPDTD